MGLSTRGMLASMLVVAFVAHQTSASLATMSIDLGSQYYKMGLVKQGSTMEMVLNRESRRKTPTLVSIRNGERLFAEAAGQMTVRYPKTVAMHLLDVLGKDEDNSLVQLHKKRFPHSPLVASDNGTLLFSDGEAQYTTESLLAMIIQHAKAETEAYAGQPVEDAVIAIPPFLSQRERLAIHSAATIAGLKVHQLLHSGTAAALSWGAFHRKDIDGKTTRMLIFDMGATHTTATLAEFSPDEKKNMRMRVLGTGYDRTLGGLEVSVRLRDHLRQRWEKENPGKSPLVESPRAMAKLLAEAERVKQVLSANTEFVSQVEALHEDLNLRLRVTREELEGLVADLFPRVTLPVDTALQMGGVTIEGVDTIALMGAATRAPWVQKKLQEHVGKDLARFLNTDEATAMGALFQSAHLSKGFKVKALPVEETVLFPVQATFSVPDDTGALKERRSSLFPLSSVYPSPNPRSITFKSFRDDFSFAVSYGDLSHLSESQQKELGEMSLLDIEVRGVKGATEELKEGDEWKETKVGFVYDPSGIVRAKNAEVLIVRPKGAMEALADSITGLFTKKEEEKEGDSSEENEAETEKKAPEEKEEKVKVEEEKKEADKKENETTATPATPSKTNSTVVVKDGMARVKLTLGRTRKDGAVTDEATATATRRMLDTFARVEKEKADRAAAENELEALAFETSLLIDEDYFILATKESERKAIGKLVTDTRAWLEDEAGVDTKTEEFKKRRREMQKALDAPKRRISEKKEAPAAMGTLKEVLAKFKVVVANVTDEDLAKDARKAGEDVEKWVGEKDKAVADNEDLPYSSLEASMKEQRLREAAKTLKRKIEKRRKEEEKKKKDEEKAKAEAEKASSEKEAGTPVETNEEKKETGKEEETVTSTEERTEL